MKHFLFLALLSLSSFANEDMVIDKKTGHLVPKYVAELKAFKGKVLKQKPGGQPVEVTAGTRFFKDEHLITQEKSFAKLLVVDDTEMTVGPSSELNFEKFEYTTKKDRNIVYGLIRGQLRGHVVNKARENELLVKTKNATMGVRGTKILVNHRTLGKLEVSEMALASGVADVFNLVKNTKHELEKDDRVVIVQDVESKAQGTLLNKLSGEDMDVLKGEEDFMPYFDIKDIKLVQNDVAPPAPSADNERLQKETKGSFHNLEQLNEKLKKKKQ